MTINRAASAASLLVQNVDWPHGPVRYSTTAHTSPYIELLLTNRPLLNTHFYELSPINLNVYKFNKKKEPIDGGAHYFDRFGWNGIQFKDVIKLLKLSVFINFLNGIARGYVDVKKLNKCITKKKTFVFFCVYICFDFSESFDCVFIFLTKHLYYLSDFFFMYGWV